MNGHSAFIAAIVAAVGGPVIAYITAARKLSGRINTSEASQLWEEAAKLRQEYRDQAIRASETAAVANHRIAELEERVNKLEMLNLDLFEQNGKLQQQVGDQKDHISRLRKELGNGGPIA